MRRFLVPVIGILLAAASSPAATLEVGESLPLTRVEDAVARAAAGDEILVHPHADQSPYARTAVLVRTPRLTIRAAGETPVQLDGSGFDYSGRGQVPRAIFQFDPAATGCTLEGFDLANARNQSFNGAGVRINAANHVTVRRCRIHGNDMGVMSNGVLADKTGADQLIEGCLITDNGSAQDPGYNHNLYLAGTSVTVRACEIARAVTGHNLKSRAHFNWIEYNYIHDSANRELDLVDDPNTDAPGSDTVLLGNFITKAASTTGNRNVIHFGRDQKHDHAGKLYLVHNTIKTFYISPVIDLNASGSSVVLFNNQINTVPRSQLIKLTNGAAADTTHADETVKWENIPLPWPNHHATALQHFLAVGHLEPRKDNAPGAGTPPSQKK